MGKRREFSLLLIIYITLAFNFYNYSVKLADYKIVLLVLDIILLFYYLMSHGILVFRGKSLFKTLIPLLFIVPYLSGINKVITAGTHFLSIPTILSTFGFLAYYVLNYKNISERRIINTFFIIGIFLFFIQIYQQVFPQKAMFGIYSEEESLLNNYEITGTRNGILRYGLAANCVILVCMYYSWGKMIENFTFKRLVFFLIFFISMYLTLTRQIVFASIASLLCTYVIEKKTNKSKRKFLSLVTFLLFVVTIGLNFQSLFGELIERTESDLTVDNIRYASFVYYGEKIFTNPLTFLIGNGFISYAASKELNLDPSDIGFVGQAYFYGILWIILWIYTIYLILYRYRKFAPLYVKLYVIGTTIQSVGIFPYRSAGECLVWATMLYLVNLRVKQSNQISILQNNTK